MMVQPSKNRIQAHRERDLKADERKLLDDVENYGCHIIHVRGDERLLGWSYTIGLFEMFREPEIIVVGLKSDTAQFLLNEITSRLKTGLHIEEGLRQDELLEAVQCEFRRVEGRSELAAVVGYAWWFYEGDPFPVFQCIYPDLEGKFPWEACFDATWRDRQALLFSDASVTPLEKDFWDSHNPESSLYDWKFSEPPHTGVYTTKRIINGEEAIVYVTHDQEDGAWQFHGPSESIPESAALVCFHHLVDKDATIKDLIDLPRGWCASRDQPSDPWVRERNSDESSS